MRWVVTASRVFLAAPRETSRAVNPAMFAMFGSAPAASSRDTSWNWQGLCQTSWYCSHLRMARDSSGMKWGGPVVQGSKDWLVLKKFTDNLLVALRVGKKL